MLNIVHEPQEEVAIKMRQRRVVAFFFSGARVPKYYVSIMLFEIIIVRKTENCFCVEICDFEVIFAFLCVICDTRIRLAVFAKSACSTCGSLFSHPSYLK